MEKLEMVEKLRERADITVEEARQILERNNWDLLDALVELEQAGRIFGGARASTEQNAPEYMTVVPTASGKEEERARRAQTRQKIRNGLKNAWRVMLENKFIVSGKGGELIRLPIIVLAVCALMNIVLTVIVLVAGMAFGLRYTVEGRELGTQPVNDGMRKAGEYTQNVVSSITGKDASARSENGQEE